MTVYARSDVAAVSISRDHGGCGESHSRPVVAGAPAKLWALTCPGGCENYLRSDPLWSGTPHTVPETPDEIAIRTDVEKKNQLELQIGNAHALAELAKLGELPTAMAQALAVAFGPILNAAPAQQAIAHLCRNGHSNSSTTKFCGECGASMDDAVNKQPVAALSGGESSEETTRGADTPDLSSMTAQQLREYAQQIGAELGRNKTEQIALIQTKLG